MENWKSSAEEFRRMVEAYTRQIDGYRRRTPPSKMTEGDEFPAKPVSEREKNETNDRAPKDIPGVERTGAGSPGLGLGDGAPSAEETPPLSEGTQEDGPSAQQPGVLPEPPRPDAPAGRSSVGDAAPLARTETDSAPSAGLPGEDVSPSAPDASVLSVTDAGEEVPSWSSQPDDVPPRPKPPLPTPSEALLRPRPVWAREKRNAPRYTGPIPPDKEDPGGLARLPVHYLPTADGWGISPPYIQSAEGLEPEKQDADGNYPPLGGHSGTSARAVQPEKTSPVMETRAAPVPKPPAPPGMPGAPVSGMSGGRPLVPGRPPSPPFFPPRPEPPLPTAGKPPVRPFAPLPPGSGNIRRTGTAGDAPEAVPVAAIPETGASDKAAWTQPDAEDVPVWAAVDRDARTAGLWKQPTDAPTAAQQNDAQGEREEISMQKEQAQQPERGLGQPFSRAGTNAVSPGGGMRTEQGCRVPSNGKPGARRTYAGQTFSGSRMTSAAGAPVPDDGNTQTVGRDGPAVMSDAFFLQKMAHFDRERIPERVVHAKGAGAFGTFESCGDASDLTMAAPFRSAGKRTQVAVRFSTVIGSRGSADTARDPRGFAVRFYTEDGNWDLVGNNMPVFFIRDAIRFPDLIHALKPDPVSELTDRTRFWDFVSLSPEAMHMVMWVYSDYGTLDSFRFMNGFGVNTFTLANREGKLRLCKFHWLSKQGVRTLTQAEADRIGAENPDVAREDLRCAIERGEYPRWELCVQTMTLEDAEQLAYDPLDDTKVWDEKAFPLRRLGVMTLNRNPENFFLQVEEAAYCPANMIPGVQASADKMLTGRMFSYQDTQRYRIGANFEQIPVNMPMHVPMNNQQDGAMAISNPLGSVNYAPNSLNGDYPRPDAGLNRPGMYYGGTLVREGISRGDDFEQAGAQYRSYTEGERENLIKNIAGELRKCNKKIQGRVVEYAKRCDEEFGEKLAEALV